MEFVSYDIESMDFRQAGAASRALKERLKLIGADAEAIRRTMIAAYEAEMNVVIHSVGGRLEASLSDSQVDVDVVDSGPGIPDIEQAMVEGFSTASAEARALGFGAGMGLPNIKKNSDRLRLTSRVGEGTRVSFTVYLRPGQTDGTHPISLLRLGRPLPRLPGLPDRLPHQSHAGAGRPAQRARAPLRRLRRVHRRLHQPGARACAKRSPRWTTCPARTSMLLVVPPALLAGCGADYPPAQVLAALRDAGLRRRADLGALRSRRCARAAAHAATAAGDADRRRRRLAP